MEGCEVHGVPRPRAGVTGGVPTAMGRHRGGQRSSLRRRAPAPGCRGAGGAPGEGLLPRREGQDGTVGPLKHGQTLPGAARAAVPPVCGLGGLLRRGEAKPRGQHRLGYLLLRKKVFLRGKGDTSGVKREPVGAPRPGLLPSPSGPGWRIRFSTFGVCFRDSGNHGARPPTLLLRSRRAGAPDFTG